MIGCGVYARGGISGWKSAKSVTLRDIWKRKSPSDQETERERDRVCKEEARCTLY